MYAGTIKTCEWCGNSADSLRKDGITKIFRVPRKGQERARLNSTEQAGKAQEFLHPMDAEELMKATWQADGPFLKLLFGGATAESFFLHALPIPPNRFRPVSRGLQLQLLWRIPTAAVS